MNLVAERGVSVYLSFQLFKRIKYTKAHRHEDQQISIDIEIKSLALSRRYVSLLLTKCKNLIGN